MENVQRIVAHLWRLAGRSLLAATSTLTSSLFAGRDAEIGGFESSKSSGLPRFVSFLVTVKNERRDGVISRDDWPDELFAV